MMRDNGHSRSSQREGPEDSQEIDYEDGPEDQEYEQEYQEHGGYDPRFQKGYLQGYGDMKFGGDYEGPEDEEGYIHESDYEPGYTPEDEQAQVARIKQGKAKSLEYQNRYSDEDIASRQEIEDASEQERGHEREYDNRNGTMPDQDELEQDHEEEQGEYLSQQQINRQGDNLGENEKVKFFI